ncbi:MAG: type VI secretion system protein TssR, partial [Oscillospiraceae bacterium]
MNAETNIKNFIGGTAFMITLLSSCAPVNMFTRLDKLPREHSDNYQIEGVKACKSEKHHTPWVVYSDRADNAAFIKRGGQIPSEQIAFADPFLVIKRKGEYLKLIKYKPENTKENRLSERKKAEFIGWVHQSNLLLSPTSMTDIRSGKKYKMLVAIRDTTTVFNARRYFKNGDSIQVYQKPDLQKPTSAIALYDIVYALKYAKDGNSILVSRTPDIMPEQVREQILGWVPTLLLQDIGGELFVETPLSKQYPQPKSLRYSPVIRAIKTDSLLTFNSGHLIPLIDKRDNRIFNIDGSALSYLQSDSIKKELRNINVVFVFEPCETAQTQFPVLLNIIQNLKTLFVSEAGKYSYQFGATLATGNGIRKLSLNTDYSAFVDSVSSVASSIFTGQTPATGVWKTLRHGLSLLKNDANATNLVVVIGERGEGSENAPADIVSSLSKLNCRIMGVQLYAAREAIYNNFVLQLSDMIEKYAAYQTV